jgi:hypothetical protein
MIENGKLSPWRKPLINEQTLDRDENSEKPKGEDYGLRGLRDVFQTFGKGSDHLNVS